MVLLAPTIAAIPFLVQATSLNAEWAQSQEAVFAVALVGLDIELLIEVASRRANGTLLFEAGIADALGVIVGVAGVLRASLALECCGVEVESRGNASAAGPLSVRG